MVARFDPERPLKETPSTEIVQNGADISSRTGDCARHSADARPPETLTDTDSLPV